jgi:DNA-binding transcriptional MerR regulator
MPSLIFQIISWPTLAIALLVFGFAPGAVLRLIVLAFPRDDPRRRELLGDLYAVPRIERPFWVIEKLELAIFEGLRGRLAHRMAQMRGVKHERGVAIDRAGEQSLLFGEGLTAHSERGVAIDRAGEQSLLFGEDLTAHPEDVGYRGPTACAAAGITYSQLDYWARSGVVEPSVRAAHGSGSQRLYSFRDILVLKAVKRLLDTGISLQQIRAAVDHLRDRTIGDLPRLTLMSDGISVYECASADEVVDLLAGGQGVSGIALGRIWQEVDGILAELPAEPA